MENQIHSFDFGHFYLHQKLSHQSYISELGVLVCHNTSNNYGWNSSWAIEAGWTCNGAPSVCQKCGDGVIQGIEVWDDSNTSNDDGWSSLCTIETGYTWSGAPSICQKWGNSHREGTETCDDGNTISGDGWSSSCLIESGYSCTNVVLNVWSIVCGNGVINAGEIWDDGNNSNNDGWSSTWQVETNWICFWGLRVFDTNEATEL